MEIPFKTQTVEGVESVMDVSNIVVSEIRFNQKTKEIFIISKKKPAKKKPAGKGKVKDETKRNTY